MAQNNGTLIINTVRPNDSQDDYPVALSNEIKGGIHSYNSFEDLSRIPILRRTPGMLVSITDDLNQQYNSIFKLSNDLNSWEYLDSKFIVTAQLDDILGSYEIYVLLSSPYIYKVSRIVTKLKVGSCNLALIKNNEYIDGLESVPVDTNINIVENLLSENNFIEENNSLKILVYSPSSNFSSLSIQLELTRILPILQLPSVTVCGLKDAYQNLYGSF